MTVFQVTVGQTFRHMSEVEAESEEEAKEVALAGEGMWNGEEEDPAYIVEIKVSDRVGTVVREQERDRA